MCPVRICWLSVFWVGGKAWGSSPSHDLVGPMLVTIFHFPVFKWPLCSSLCHFVSILQATLLPNGRWWACFCSLALENHLCLKSFILLDQFSSVAQSCPTLWDPMNRSTPGLPVHHQLLEFTQTHVHRVSDAIQPSHPRSSPSPPASNPSQHQSLFQWVNSSHEVAKVLEIQL